MCSFLNYDTENICFVLKTTLLESMPAKTFLNKLSHFLYRGQKFLNLFFRYERESRYIIAGNHWKNPLRWDWFSYLAVYICLCMAFCMPQLNSLFCRNNIVTPSREQQFPWAGLKMFCFFRANNGRENCGR